MTCLGNIPFPVRAFIAQPVRRRWRTLGATLLCVWGWHSLWALIYTNPISFLIGGAADSVSYQIGCTSRYSTLVDTFRAYDPTDFMELPGMSWIWLWLAFLSLTSLVGAGVYCIASRASSRGRATRHHFYAYWWRASVLGAPVLAVLPVIWPLTPLSSEFPPIVAHVVYAAGAAFAGPFVVRRLHVLLRAWFRRYCRRCGYSLRGNVSGVCPECGTARSFGPNRSP